LSYSTQWRPQGIAELAVIQSGGAMFTACARLRASCQLAGHALGARFHDGDRWISAAAIRLDCPLVSRDTVFKDAPASS